MKLSLSFFPNLDKTSPKTGKIPIYLRLVLDRKKAETKLNIEVTPEELLKWDNKTMRFTDREMSANALLNSIDKNFEDFRHHQSTKLREYNVKTIRNLILGHDSNSNPVVLTYINKYYDNTIEPNAQMTDGTKRNYRKALKHLREYLTFRKIRDIALKDVDVKFANGFKDYLLGSFPNCNRTGMKESSALDNVKRLRTIFDRAVDEELMLFNPFKKVRLRNSRSQRARLDIHQIKSIYGLDLQSHPTQRIYRDLFLFSAFTGLVKKG